MIRRPLIIVDGRIMELTDTDSIVGVINEEDIMYSKRIDFVSDSEIYKAEALVGGLDSGPVWRIRKILIGIDGDISETWASGTALFDKVWNDRAIYTYL